MTNCVDCLDPPGGTACCESPDDTPMCFIKDGKANTVCLQIPKSGLGSDESFRRHILIELRKLIEKEYREEFLKNFEVTDGIARFESADGRMKITARNMFKNPDPDTEREVFPVR